jgi:dATP pyrophosphohydrolase
MARAPFQVLVYACYPTQDSEFAYLLLKRSDEGWWQGIAGGGEDSETPLEAAKRETLEETGIPKDSRFLQLITVLPIPASGLTNSTVLLMSVHFLRVLLRSIDLLSIFRF